MWLVNLLKGLPSEWIIIIIAAMPVIEVRGAIPIGLMYFHLPATTVLPLSIIGSVLPALPLLWFLNTLTEKLRKVDVLDKFFAWLFTRTRAKSRLIADFELIGLALFIGVPLPGTGVWTGVIAAYLLGLPWLPTFFAAAAGTAIASVIMWAASAGIIHFFL